MSENSRIERPIIFSAPMVRAILAGTKTQTRRLATSPLAKCRPGDRLWVRETWAGPILAVIDGDMGERILYRATEPGWTDHKGRPPTWRPSIHMPRWASRITLEVTAVKVERLQDISEPDAKAEGVELTEDLPAGRTHHASYRAAFSSLWNRLHWKDLRQPSAWDANPEVVAITFRRVDPLPSSHRGTGVR